MKQTIILVAACIGFLFSAQDAKAQGNWPELKAFHGVMSQTFHPMEEGDFKPIRSRSGEMAEKAKAVAKSSIPAEYNSKEIVMAVKQLAKDSKKLNKLVKKDGTDAAITTSLTALHDVFHKIMGLCNDHGH
ncbi:MAG: hypothetical protein IPJ00_12745 [Saprospirales bacterium]|jgi:hypothetical protein|nr:hypothetical protein [Saprospirales bacterium]MBK7336979.1 hypothetical protein [Saprospirales bacterium]